MARACEGENQSARGSRPAQYSSHILALPGHSLTSGALVGDPSCPGQVCEKSGCFLWLVLVWMEGQRGELDKV